MYFPLSREAERCSLASTLGKARESREDNDLFLNDFFKAFSQMLETGILPNP